MDRPVAAVKNFFHRKSQPNPDLNPKNKKDVKSGVNKDAQKSESKANQHEQTADQKKPDFAFENDESSQEFLAFTAHMQNHKRSSTEVKILDLIDQVPVSQVQGKSSDEKTHSPTSSSTNPEHDSDSPHIIFGGDANETQHSNVSPEGQSTPSPDDEYPDLSYFHEQLPEPKLEPMTKKEQREVFLKGTDGIIPHKSAPKPVSTNLNSPVAINKPNLPVDPATKYSYATLSQEFVAIADFPVGHAGSFKVLADNMAEKIRNAPVEIRGRLIVALKETALILVATMKKDYALSLYDSYLAKGNDLDHLSTAEANDHKMILKYGADSEGKLVGGMEGARRRFKEIVDPVAKSVANPVADQVVDRPKRTMARLFNAFLINDQQSQGTAETEEKMHQRDMDFYADGKTEKEPAYEAAAIVKYFSSEERLKHDPAVVIRDYVASASPGSLPVDQSQAPAQKRASVFYPSSKK